MRWSEAVKLWNERQQSVNPRHCYCQPRKGTPEHAEVKMIHAEGKAAAKAAEKGAADKAAKEKEAKRLALTEKFRAAVEARRAAKEKEAKRQELTAKLRAAVAARRAQKSAEMSAAPATPVRTEYTSQPSMDRGGRYAALPLRVYANPSGEPLFAVAKELNERYLFEQTDQEGEYYAKGIRHPNYEGEFGVFFLRTAGGKPSIVVEKSQRRRRGDPLETVGQYAPQKSLELYTLPKGAHPFKEEPQSQSLKKLLASKSS